MIACPIVEIPDAARAVLEGPALAHLVTLEPDGRPQISIVWVGLDGDELVAGHLPEHRKIKNIRRDPRVALSVEAGTKNKIGLDEYIVIHGRAYVTEGGARSCSSSSPTPTSAPTSSSRRWTTRRPATSRTSPSSGSAVWGRGRADGRQRCAGRRAGDTQRALRGPGK